MSREIDVLVVEDNKIVIRLGADYRFTADMIADEIAEMLIFRWGAEVTVRESNHPKAEVGR